MSRIYQPTDIVLAKVKGYPAWPAMVVPIELIPENVMRSRHQQVSKRKGTGDKDMIDGDEIEEEESGDDNPDDFIVYSEILKFKKFNTPRPQYCVKFFCDDSYIWVRSADLKPLSSEQCNAWLKKPSSRNKKLIPAFEMASKGIDGIDVWEFIEYGSAGKPDEEEYVEYEEEEEEEEEAVSADENSGDEYEEGRRRTRPARSSARQKQKRAKEASSNRRATRSRKQTDELSDEPLESDDEIIAPKAKRAKLKPKGRTRPTVPKYKYEDDEDWILVGRGPQDLSIQQNMSSFAHKLSQKRNVEDHVDTKLELADRLHGINKLFLEIIIPNNETSKTLKEDYEVLLDELSLALSIRGFHDEFVTVFQSSNELLAYFRLLFNLKQTELRDWDLWDQFQDYFETIYNHKFIPDRVQWSKDEQSIRGSELRIEQNGRDEVAAGA